MKLLFSSLFCCIFSWFIAQESVETISQDLLLSVRYNDPYQPLERQLQEISLDELVEQLNTENKKKAFWLNIYNAYIQLIAKDNPTLLTGNRNQFFGKKWISIAGISLSFDDIEHGIIRHSQWKLGKGYITRWFPGKTEKQLRVNQIDYRIHFALNCGAKSCPPIAYYQSEQLDQQLDEATKGFLISNTLYDSTINTVTVTRLMSWFSGDFGGKKGQIELLKSYNLIPKDKNPKIIYSPYDWTVDLQQYAK